MKEQSKSDVANTPPVAPPPDPSISPTNTPAINPPPDSKPPTNSSAGIGFSVLLNGLISLPRWLGSALTTLWRWIGPEIILILFIVITFIIIVKPDTDTSSPTTSHKSTATPTPTQDQDSTIFTLPAAKIQSDFSVLKLNDDVVVTLVGSHGTTHYMAKLHDVRDAGNQQLPQKYQLKQGDTVYITLTRGTNDAQARDFAIQLMNATAIFLWPSLSSATPASTPITSVTPTTTPAITFNLPGDKIQSNLSQFKTEHSITVLLVVDHQVYSQAATLEQILTADGKPAPTLYEKGMIVSISLKNATNDDMINFASRLSDASIIYLEPAPPTG